MSIFEKLGLGNKKKSAEQQPIANKSTDQKGREDKIPAAAQDMCCGGCHGHGHGDRKDQRR